MEAGVLDGQAGAWVPLLPTLDGTVPVSAVDVRKRLADRLAVATDASLVLEGTRYRSPLERDVAVALTAVDFKFDIEVLYPTLIDTTHKWTADFVVRSRNESGPLVVVIEVTGRPDAQDTLDEKLKALVDARVPHIVVRSQRDLRGFVKEVVQLAKAVPSVPKVEDPKDPNAPHVTKGGVYLDPRGIRRDRTRPVLSPQVVAASNLPPRTTPGPIPGLNIPDWRILQVLNLEEEDDDKFVRDRVGKAREVANAELKRRKLTESIEQRAARLLKLLEADTPPYRRRVGTPDAETSEPEYHIDPRDEVIEELTGEECSEQDELPDDLEAGRGER